MDAHAPPPVILLAAYCGLILMASLAGGWLPFWIELTHTRLQVATSFVAGMMLGVGLLHLLPHAWRQLPSADQAAGWLLAGFLTMFFIQRFFHFHHHDVPEEDPDWEHAALKEPPHATKTSPQAWNDQPHHHSLAGKSARHLSWSGAALGLTLHTLINGMALAASVQVEQSAPHPELLAGFGTFLVILLHKPFDAMAISTLMASGGWSRSARHLINALFALAIPAGVLLFYLGGGYQLQAHPVYMGAALAFAAGSFLCIAASDLLPELQFHAHDRIKLTVALGLGVAFSLFVNLFERHGHGP